MAAPATPFTVCVDSAFTVPEMQAELEANFRVVVCADFDPIGVPPELIASVVGLLCRGHAKVNAAVLAKWPNLRAVVAFGVGYDHITVPDCTAAGLPVGNSPGVIGAATADLAMGLLLAAARNIVVGDTLIRGPSFTKIDSNWFGREVHGAVVGVVGLGSVGKAVARRAGLGFDMRVLYHCRSRKAPEEEAAAGAATYCPTLDGLLAASDFVVLCAPGGEGTRNMISGPQLSCMKRSGFLINVGRGSLVDQGALDTALRTGVIAGAAVDVTDPEPLARDHPLMSAPNLIITPHMGTATLNTRLKMLRLAIANLTAGAEGRPLVHSVNDVPPRATL